MMNIKMLSISVLLLSLIFSCRHSKKEEMLSEEYARKQLKFVANILGSSKYAAIKQLESEHELEELETKNIAITLEEEIIFCHEENDIGPRIVREFKLFETMSLDQFKSKLAYFGSLQTTFLMDMGDLGAPFGGDLKKVYLELKDGGEDRFVNWETLKFLELDTAKKAGGFKGELTGVDYVFYEILCAVNSSDKEKPVKTCSFIPMFAYNGKKYQLVYLVFQWTSF